MSRANPEAVLTEMVQIVMDNGYDVDDDMTIHEFVDAVDYLVEHDEELDEETKGSLKKVSTSFKKMLGYGNRGAQIKKIVNRIFKVKPKKKANPFAQWKAKPTKTKAPS